MMIIRPFRLADAPFLHAIYIRSVRVLGARFYEPQAVEAWASLAPGPARLIELMADGRARLVAADAQDAPVAFGDLTPDGLIHYLYCAPEAAGAGAARGVYKAIEAEARQRGLDRLHAEASEAARGFFERQGFTVLERRDFEIAGAAIHNYAVEKRLSPPAPHKTFLLS